MRQQGSEPDVGSLTTALEESVDVGKAPCFLWSSTIATCRPRTCREATGVGSNVRGCREASLAKWRSLSGCRSWLEAYEHPVETPHGYWIEDIDGEIPKEITGTYFRNGPGRMRSGGSTVEHPFDADGLVASIAIKEGRAFFRSRFVTTDAFVYFRVFLKLKEGVACRYLREVDAGRRLTRGAFGTQPHERRLFDWQTRNASNTNVALWKQRLWTLYECSQPYELDPYTLRTQGPTHEPFLKEGALFDPGTNPAIRHLIRISVNESVTEPRPLTREQGAALTAHPKFDPENQRTLLHTYSLQFSDGPGYLKTSLWFYEFTQEGEMKRRVEYSVPGFLFLHEIAFTKNYYVVIENPVEFDLWSYIRQESCAVGSIKWKPQSASKVHFIERPKNDFLASSHTTANSTIVEVPPSFVFHIANAYEHENTVVIDAVHYKRFPDQVHPPAKHSLRALCGRLRRIVCDLSKREVVWSTDVLLRAIEFPHINGALQGRTHRYVYALAGMHSYRNAPPQILTKVDPTEAPLHRTEGHGKHYFAGEPVFIPRQNHGVSSLEEDDGWILSLCYNGITKRSEVVILDARCLEDGPVATLKLLHRLPHGYRLPH